MASPTDYPAQGKVIAVKDGMVVFNPINTNYEMLVMSAGGAYAGPVNSPVRATIRVNARKVYSVPSGGNFVAPIFGPPKIIQGRVRMVNGNEIVMQAGTSIVVNLPAEDNAIDCSNGAIAVNSLINVVALPGATFEVISDPATVAAMAK